MDRVITPEEIAELMGRFSIALLRSSNDPIEVAHTAVDQVSRIMGAEIAYLALLSAEDRRLEVIASVGLPAQLAQRQASIPLETGFIAAIAARTGELQEVTNIGGLPDYEEYRALKALTPLGVNSYFAMPLTVTGERIGVVSIARGREGRLSALDLSLFGATARAIALTIHHARSRELEQKANTQIRTIREALLSIEAGAEPKSFLRELVIRACELLKARYGALGILNEQGTGIAEFITVGVSEETQRKIGHFPEGKGILGAVIRERRPIRLAKISDDPRSSGFPPHHPMMTTFLGVPLRIGQRVFGNFYLADKAGGREFTEEDERLLELFGTQAALAVDHASKAAEIEKQRRKQAETFHELEQLRNEFAAIVSHDLKNPIQAILLQAQRLQIETSRAGDGRLAAAMDGIMCSARNLTQMAEDLYEASRLETRQLRLDRKPTDLGGAISTLVERLKPTLGNHPIDVKIGTQVPRVSVDPVRFDQILTNLLENSAKYSDENLPITVVLNAVEGGAEIQVTDQGVGIASEEMPLLFDRFYQAKRGREKKSGLGLGLYITKGLVEAHQGRVSVESKAGKGTTFRVWLPIGESTEATTPIRAA